MKYKEYRDEMDLWLTGHKSHTNQIMNETPDGDATFKIVVADNLTAISLGIGSLVHYITSGRTDPPRRSGN